MSTEITMPATMLRTNSGPPPGGQNYCPCFCRFSSAPVRREQNRNRQTKRSRNARARTRTIAKCVTAGSAAHHENPHKAHLAAVHSFVRLRQSRGEMHLL